VAGRVPHASSEADPAALLVQVLVAFGNLVGRTAHFVAESDRHFANLYVVLVGQTAKGRKGSSWAQVRRVFQMAAPTWVKDKIRSGLSSGEGLMMPVQDVEAENGGVTTADKRLLVMEPEFASALHVMSREGNTLSAKLRQAWDTGDLATMVRRDPVKVNGAHISLIGHITKDELRATLSRTDMGNGFANRILWVAARRSKSLPDGGTLRDEDLAPLALRLAELADALTLTRLERGEAAREVWHAVYPSLSEGKPGLLGAIISRAEAQVMRLAMVYALLDGHENHVARVHLLAALAVWDYCEATARYIFGDALGDPIADEILRALRNTPHGLTRTAIRDLFGRHRSGDQVGRALALLLERGLAAMVPEETGGRPAERWSATMRHPTDRIEGYLDLAKRCAAEDPEIVEGVPNNDPAPTVGRKNAPRKKSGGR